MKKILFIGLFLSSLFGKTLVVDDDYSILWGGSICEHGSPKWGWLVGYYDYSSIKDALNDAVNGDTIKICPGSYNESNLKVDKNILILFFFVTNRISHSFE